MKDPNRKTSPANICIFKRQIEVPFDPEDVIQELEHHQLLPVTVEKRAWVCPFCEQSTEYYLVNGRVLTGLASSTMLWRGKESDCCDRYECRERQKKFHYGDEE
jgi:hypothetical protein